MPQTTTRSNSARASSANAASDFACCAIALPTVSQPSRSRSSGVSGSGFHTVGSWAQMRLGSPVRSMVLSRRATPASTTGNTAECPGGACAASALRLPAITPIRASYDFANLSIPSSSSTRVTSSMSTPPAASRLMTARASPASSLSVVRTVPWSSNNWSVAGGIVLMVSAPMSESTYSTSE